MKHSESASACNTVTNAQIYLSSMQQSAQQAITSAITAQNSLRYSALQIKETEKPHENE